MGKPFHVDSTARQQTVKQRKTSRLRGNSGYFGGEKSKQNGGDEPTKLIHKMGGRHAAKSHMGRHLVDRQS